MRTVFLVTLLCLVVAARASQAASADTTITKVLLNPHDSAHICVIVAFAPFEAAESQDGGRTFAVIRAASIPPELVPGTASANFRYLAVGSSKYHLVRLFRSEDGGTKWEETGFRKFLHEQLEKVADQERGFFVKRYADRLAHRTESWTKWFFILSAGYLIGAAWLLRGKGFWSIVWNLAASALALAVVGCVLSELRDEAWFFTLRGHEAGLLYWHSAPEWSPTAKLGVILNVASLPTRLILFFLVIIPILPASVTLIGRYLNRRAGDKAWPLMACRAFALLLWTFLVITAFSPWPFGGFWA